MTIIDRIRPIFALNKKHTVVIEGSFEANVFISIQDRIGKYLWTISTPQPVASSGNGRLVVVQVTPTLAVAAEKAPPHHDVSDVNGNISVTITNSLDPNDTATTTQFAVIE